MQLQRQRLFRRTGERRARGNDAEAHRSRPRETSSSGGAFVRRAQAGRGLCAPCAGGKGPGTCAETAARSVSSPAPEFSTGTPTNAAPGDVNATCHPRGSLGARSPGADPPLSGRWGWRERGGTFVAPTACAGSSSTRTCTCRAPPFPVIPHAPTNASRVGWSHASVGVTRRLESRVGWSHALRGCPNSFRSSRSPRRSSARPPPARRGARGARGAQGAQGAPGAPCRCSPGAPSPPDPRRPAPRGMSS